MMHANIVAFALSTLILGSMAAECQDNWRQIRKRLRRNEKKWLNKAPSASCYNMTIQRQCFCWQEEVGPFDLQIFDGAIRNNTYEYQAEPPTLEGLFDLVREECLQGCPKKGPAKCRVEFDKQYGYITSLYVDRYKRTVDDEVKYIVSNVAFCES